VPLAARLLELSRFSVRRVALASAEVAVSLGTALVFAYWSTTVNVNPMMRVGQVSGLAALQVRLLAVGLPLLAAVTVSAFRGSERLHRLLVRFGCAVVAGLATGFIAGGIVVALHGTPWPLAGQGEDNGHLADWAAIIIRTGHLTNIYPPLLPHLQAWWAVQFTGGEPSLAMKQLQTVMIAVGAPAAYLSWRLFLRPLPALGVGLVSSLPVVLPYKPYSPLVLIILVPLLGKFLQVLRRAPRRPLRESVWLGLFLGVGFALLFLLYAGWHVWSAPGVVIAVLALFPWRSGRQGVGRALAFLGTTTLAFGLVAGKYVLVLLSATGTKDRWCSPMVLVDPAFIAMSPYPYRAANTMGGWPPPGEFGGVGVFSVLMIVGIGVALALGLHRSPVVVTTACFLSAWVIRFWISHNMQRDQAVQLYVRTYHQLLYCGLVLMGWAVVLTGRWVHRRLQALPDTTGLRVPGPGRTRIAAVAVLTAGLLFGGMVASATADSYLPENPKYGWLSGQAWVAHQIRKPDGACPKYADHGQCSDPRPYPTRTPPADPDSGRMSCEYPWKQDG
jgi:galactan 5-O-arabinofuranosyltransferase